MCVCVQVLVEIALNVAKRGTFRPSDALWQQLRAARHRNTIRRLLATQAVSTWRQLLSSHVDTAQLLARCLLEEAAAPRHRARASAHSSAAAPPPTVAQTSATADGGDDDASASDTDEQEH